MWWKRLIPSGRIDVSPKRDAAENVASVEGKPSRSPDRTAKLAEVNSMDELISLIEEPKAINRITDADWEKAAQELGVEVALLRAIAQKESSGQGFDESTQKPKIRIEPHRVSAYMTGEKAEKAVEELYSLRQETDQEKVWQIFTELLREDPVAAIYATTFGLMQVEGFVLDGVKTKEGVKSRVVWATDLESEESREKIKTNLFVFLRSFLEEERAHLEMLVKYAKEAKPSLLEAMQALDWQKIARLYNGPNYEDNCYDLHIAEYYLHFGGARKEETEQYIKQAKEYYGDSCKPARLPKAQKEAAQQEKAQKQEVKAAETRRAATALSAPRQTAAVRLNLPRTETISTPAVSQVNLAPRYTSAPQCHLRTELGSRVYYTQGVFWGEYVLPYKDLTPPLSWNDAPVERPKWCPLEDVSSPTSVYSSSRDATEADWDWAASQLGVEKALIKAFAQIESNLKGFWPSGKPKILIEIRMIPGKNKARGWAEDSRYYLQPKRCLEGDQAKRIQEELEKAYKKEDPELRWRVFDELLKIDPVGAILNTSFGLFQMLGMMTKPEGSFHREVWGDDIAYRKTPRNTLTECSADVQQLNDSSESKVRESLLRFKDAMCTNERTQIEWFVAYCKYRKPLHSAMKTLHWAKMAKLYNGSGYRSHNYDIKLAKAYLQHGGANKISASEHISKPEILRSQA